jgi:hypothetical protein
VLCYDTGDILNSNVKCGIIGNDHHKIFRNTVLCACSWFVTAKDFQTVQHVLSITAFYMRKYRPGQTQSSFTLLCILFGIIPFVDAPNGPI